MVSVFFCVNTFFASPPLSVTSTSGSVKESLRLKGQDNSIFASFRPSSRSSIRPVFVRVRGRQFVRVRGRQVRVRGRQFVQFSSEFAVVNSSSFRPSSRSSIRPSSRSSTPHNAPEKKKISGKGKLTKNVVAEGESMLLASRLANLLL
jgi:hypothetical protein